MRLTLFFAAFLLAASTGTVTGQAAGPLPKVDGHRIPLGVDSFAIFVLRGRDTIRTGAVRDEITSDGTNLIRVYWSVDKVLGDQLDTIVDRLSDLSPVSYHGRSSEFLAQVGFDSLSASGWIRLVNGDSTRLDVALPHPIYGGTSFDLVARAADLAAGLTVSVPVFLVESHSVSTLPGSVVGSESVDGHDCWMFRGDFGAMPVTFWIDKSSRSLRRQLMQIRSDLGILFTAVPPPKVAPKRSV